MRFIHSLSTRPLFIDLYNTSSLKRLVGNIAYYALSFAYLKRLNQTVVLHTDSLGKSLLSFIPYDEIHLTADDIPDSVSPRFWAAAKMYAIEKEQLGAIHIDGDVFIKSKKCLDIIENSEYDVLVQTIEKEKWSKPYYVEFDYFENERDYLKQNNLELGIYGAYNTGILSFNNKKLKDDFIKGYKNIVTHHSSLYKHQLLTDKSRTPDLLAEQTNIYQLSKDYNVKVLIEENDKPILDRCNEIGYQHVITVAKFNQLDKCLDTLKQIDIELYNKTYKLCHNILKK